MKHGLKQRKLNRTSSHRLALLKNLSISLIKHETITTTTEKAKELRPFIEKLVTKAKNDNLSNRKFVLSKLFNNKEACQKLFNEISAQNKDRNGGYTRIIKAGFRYGDNAPMAIIEFVDRDVQARRIDKPKKDKNKETPKTEEKKQATA